MERVEPRGEAGRPQLERDHADTRSQRERPLVRDVVGRARLRRHDHDQRLRPADLRVKPVLPVVAGAEDVEVHDRGVPGLLEPGLHDLREVAIFAVVADEHVSHAGGPVRVCTSDAGS